MWGQSGTNPLGIAAAETLKLLGSLTCGVGLTLHKVRDPGVGGGEQGQGFGGGGSRGRAGCGGSLGH
jgi:hypothetical protein